MTTINKYEIRIPGMTTYDEGEWIPTVAALRLREARQECSPDMRLYIVEGDERIECDGVDDREGMPAYRAADDTDDSPFELEGRTPAEWFSDAMIGSGDKPATVAELDAWMDEVCAARGRGLFEAPLSDAECDTLREYAAAWAARDMGAGE